MAHILFFEACDASFTTIAHALDRGHRVTLMSSSYFEHRTMTDFIHATKARIQRIVPISLPYSVDDLTDTVSHINHSDPIEGVICQEDFIVEEAARVCERIGLRFTSSHGVSNARNKYQARQLLETANLPTVRCSKVLDATSAMTTADAIGYPVVVKPARGLDSAFVRKCNNSSEVSAASQAILATANTLPPETANLFATGILIEQCLQGEVLSVECGKLDNQFIPFMVSGRCSHPDNPCQPMGAVMPADLLPSDEVTCIKYAERVCDALGLNLGIFHLEMMLTATGPVLIEANPRIMGGGL